MLLLRGVSAVLSVPNNCSLTDICALDLTMPVCDGFKSTEMIREYEQQLRKTSPTRKRSIIIAFTGLASAADQDKAFAAGVDRFVTKPLRFKDFKILLQTCGILGGDDSVLGS